MLTWIIVPLTNDLFFSLLFYSMVEKHHEETLAADRGFALWWNINIRCG